MTTGMKTCLVNLDNKNNNNNDDDDNNNNNDDDNNNNKINPWVCLCILIKAAKAEVPYILHYLKKSKHYKIPKNDKNNKIKNIIK